MIDASGAGRPRVASWPHAYGPNPYLPLLYRALAERGIEHAPNVPLDATAFAGPGRRADVLHLHWLDPLFREGRSLWRPRARLIRKGLERLESIKRLGVPIVWTVHNVRPHDGFRPGEQQAYSRVHSVADLRLFHSESALAETRALFGAVGSSTLVMPHGNFQGAFPPPRPRAEVLAREGVPAGRRVLLCFGQVREYKGFDVAVRAMGDLKNDNCHLVVAGRPIGRGVRGLVRLARDSASVTLLLDVLPPQRISDLLGAADVVLLPYRAITGSGALLHALTAGRGVVASDLPYFREVLAREPGAGVLVSPDDPAALAAGVRAVLALPREQLERAATRLGRAFDWGVIVEPLARWIQERTAGDPLTRFPPAT